MAVLSLNKKPMNILNNKDRVRKMPLQGVFYHMPGADVVYMEKNIKEAIHEKG